MQQKEHSFCNCECCEIKDNKHIYVVAVFCVKDGPLTPKQVGEE